VLCEAQPLLPVGRSDQARKYTVSLYCPCCNDIYFPKSSRHANIDGAYFGTTFPHLFLMTYPQDVPQPPKEVFVPRVFGFRIRRAGDGSGSASPAAAGRAVRGVGPAGPPQLAATPARAEDRRRGELTTILPRDSAGRTLGRDGRPVTGGDDFYDLDEIDELQRASALAVDGAAPTSGGAAPVSAAAAAAAEDDEEEEEGGAEAEVAKALSRSKI
jgi:hypothetical protein